MLLRRGLVVVGLLLAAGAVGSSSADAANARYASPNGTGAICGQASPCSLQTAIQGAAAGDDVFVVAGQGDYSMADDLGTDMSIPIHVHGIGGRPHIVSSGGEFRFNGSSTGDNLLFQGAQKTAVALEDGATGDRLVVIAGSGAHACYMRSSTLTNSICMAFSGSDIAIELDGSNTLRNDTFFGGSHAAAVIFGRNPDCQCTSATDTLVNVIARSSAASTDIETNSSGSVPLTVNITYSNFGTLTKSDNPSSIQANTDGTDQTAMPKFVNTSAGNFHQLDSSPTVDAGTTAAANGSTDIDGNARALGQSTDIGADELVPAPNTEITKTRVRSSRNRVTFTFTSTGNATGFQCLFTPKHTGVIPPYKTCTSPKTYKHLDSGRYRFRVRAVGPGGADATPATKIVKI
jgi:hypothetical protein